MKIKRILSAAVLSALAGSAFAGTGGQEFQQVYEQISGWTNGVLGKSLAVASLLVGLGIGIIKQSVMAGVVGVGMGLVAGFGPGVIDGVVTAALPVIQPI